MKTLEEHTRERQKVYDKLDEWNVPHVNGIACPKCGKELWDTNPNMILTSSPPQKDIHCLACGYSGYRLA
jgi:DNA-directed RNA polymerase subunit RPC12/RpoP